jgi:aryl-alcohol dehydrogenase-like predicted oxidoreductase
MINSMIQRFKNSKMSVLGNTGIRISEIGFGCMSLGNDHVSNGRLLHAAVDAGINFFDTADLYARGENELTVGNAFKDRRDKVIIATKVGNRLREDGSGWDWNPTRAYILQAVEQSLRRLQTDYIDLYQLHGGTIEDPIDETISAFEELKQQGKIRAYGISSIRPNVIREYVKRSSIASVMMQYSLLDRRPEETCFELLSQHGVSVLTRGSLASGLLVDKAAKEYLGYNAGEVERARLSIRDAAEYEYRTRNTEYRISKENAMNANTKEDGFTAAQVALRFALHAAVVASAVTGIRTLEQLHQAVEAMQMPALSSEAMASLRQVLPANKYESHR